MIDMLGALSGTKILVTLTAFSHLQTASKIDTLLALWKLGGREPEDGFTKSMERARAICDFRNRIVHAYWAIGDDGVVSAVRFSARGEFKRQKVRVTVPEILERVRECGAIEQALRGLREYMAENPFRPE